MGTINFLFWHKYMYVAPYILTNLQVPEPKPRGVMNINYHNLLDGRLWIKNMDSWQLQDWGRFKFKISLVVSPWTPSVALYKVMDINYHNLKRLWIKNREKIYKMKLWQWFKFELCVVYVLHTWRCSRIL